MWLDFTGVIQILEELSISPSFTFVIRMHEDRPSIQPIGYTCVYDSWFQKDAKLWFSIP